MTRPRPVRPADPDPAPVPAASGAEPADFPPVWPYPIEESPRRLRVAIATAAALHALLLLIPMPATEAEVPDPEKKEYRLVPTQRFKPPPPPDPEPVREPRARRVPIPDPDPTDPEPIRPIEVVRPVLDLPPLDPVIDFPEGPPPEPEHSGPYEIGGPVNAPVRVEAPLPVYPEMARRVRLECTVLLKSVIDERGRVTDVAVEKECPFGMTDAAIDAVERWRYRPATRKGLPVPVYMNLRVTFSLN